MEILVGAIVLHLGVQVAVVLGVQVDPVAQEADLLA
jgi:hypothetical protein